MASVAVRSKAVILLLLFHCKLPLFVGGGWLGVWSLYYKAVLICHHFAEDERAGCCYFNCVIAVVLLL